MSRHNIPKKVLFLINPAAGGKDKVALHDMIKAFCEKHTIFHKIIKTKKKPTLQKLSAEIAAFEPECVVAAGGDGTVNLAGQLLINTDIPLAIIPLGSSNALAKNLKIPLTEPDALKTIFHFHTRYIDTLMINGYHCLHICDVGFNANLIKRSHHSKLRGMFTYGVSLLQELFTFRFFKYKLLTPKEKLEGKAFSITITNMKLYGSRAAINPKGKISDGLFEICLIKPFPYWKLLPMTIELFKGRIHLSPYSIFVRASEATLYNLQKESVHIDGEPMHLSKEIKIQIMPKSLRVVVPHGDV